MIYVNGDEVRTVTDVKRKRMLSKKVVKNAIDYSVHEYLVNSVKISDFAPNACEMWNNVNKMFDEPHIPFVANVTVTIIFLGIDELPADTDTFQTWFEQNIQIELQFTNK